MPGKAGETKKSRKYRKHREQERVKARRKDRNLEKSRDRIPERG